LYTYVPDHPDISAWAGDGLHCQYGRLRPGIGCGEADRLVDEAGREADPARRLALYDQAEALWFGPEGVFPVAPLYVGVEVVGLSPRLAGGSGYFATGAARFDLWRLAGGG
jgi:hypothetical protein